MRDDRRHLNPTSELVLWFGLGLLGIHLYLQLYTLFSSFGLFHPLVTQKLTTIIKNSPWLIQPYTLKLFAGVCIGYYSYGNRGVKSATLTPRMVFYDVLLGLLFYVGSIPLLGSEQLLTWAGVMNVSWLYLGLAVVGVLYIIKGMQRLNRLLNFRPGKDEFNEENESFPQEERLLENKYSVNLPMLFVYKEQLRKGWLNISAPFRGSLIMGIAGSGKTYGIINPIIRQHMEKGFSMYVYDYKFPELSLVTFNAMVRHRKKLHPKTKFYCLNFTEPQKSHRCNPLSPDYLPRIENAYQSAKAMMINLNKKWIDQGGEFFVESPINYITAVIWYLRNYQSGRYCTVPHLVELVNKGHRKLFPILASYPDIENLMSPFISAFQGGANDQLEGQMASAQMGLAKLSSPTLYWVMSGNDFTLDINNPKAPKVLCLGNQGDTDEIYGAALGLYNFRVMELINQKKKHPSSVIIDELPTLYVPGLSKLINTGRSRKIAVTIAMQDFSQLEAIYGRAQAETIKNNCGNIISGQVYDKTAEAMQNRIGKNVQQKQSINIQSEDTTHGISTELNYMAPAAKIGQLSQGHVVGVLADNEGQESRKKAFNCQVVVDKDDFNAEQKLEELPDFSIFADNSLDDRVQENYQRIRDEVNQLIDSELSRLGDAIKQWNSKPASKHGRRNQ